MIPDDRFKEICQDCADYIKMIYSKICFVPDEIEVTFEILDHVHFTIKGNERDDGIMIGRKGITVNSLRTFIYAYSKTHMEGRPCVIEVRDHQGSRFNPMLMKASPYRKRGT